MENQMDNEMTLEGLQGCVGFWISLLIVVRE